MRKEIVIIGKSLNEYDFDPRYEDDEDLDELDEEQRKFYESYDYDLSMADYYHDIQDMED